MGKLVFEGRFFDTVDAFMAWWEAREIRARGDDEVITIKPDRVKTGIIGVMTLPAAERPCILKTGCPGRMTAVLRRWHNSSKPSLCWHCATCNVLRVEAIQEVDWDHRAALAAREDEAEVALAEVLMTSAGEVPIADTWTEDVDELKEDSGARRLREKP